MIAGGAGADDPVEARGHQPLGGADERLDVEGEELEQLAGRLDLGDPVDEEPVVRDQPVVPAERVEELRRGGGADQGARADERPQPGVPHRPAGHGAPDPSG